MILVILYLVILVYCIVIIYLIYGYSKINDFENLNNFSKTTFSILVPFRDEAENLPILLKSFSKLNYPKHLFEVILIDDDTFEKFKILDFEFKVSVIKNKRLTNSPKKDAIATAVKMVCNEWIITTDADCIVPENWLLILDQYIQDNKVSMIVGAVSYACNNSFLHRFQQFDFTSLQAATIGSFGLKKGFICNGANFAYTKSFFQELNGYEGNAHIASGDDVFLLQKAMCFSPERVHYLKSKSNTVVTKPVNNWKSLFNQRARWVSKTSSFESSFGVCLGFVVLITNLVWIFVLGSVILGFLTLKQTIFFFVIKFWVEQILIRKTADFLNQGKLSYLLLIGLVHPFFNVAIGLFSLFGKYDWKGRKFS